MSDPQPDTIRSRTRGIFQSRGMRFLIMISLIVLMAIPIFMVWGVVADRANYNEAAVNEVSEIWGGRIGVAGPVVVVPVTRTITTVTKDENGNEIAETEDVEGPPVVLLPDETTIAIDTTGQIRSRGIFEIPVYSAAFDINARFNLKNLSAVLREGERIRPDEAEVVLKLPSRRAFTGDTVVQVNDIGVSPEPGTPFATVPGIRMPADMSGPAMSVQIRLGLNGAQTLSVSPLARNTRATITSDWPDPSFGGSFLPNERTVSDTGFTATWEISHLAFDLPHISRDAVVLHPKDGQIFHHRDNVSGPISPFNDGTAFGVRFIQELDFYQRVERAVKYGFLFISLTFLTLFLLEGLSRTPVHPAQFLLIGLAECVFFLLLLSFAEQVGFGFAYLGASAATIALLGFYGVTALQLGRRVWILITLLVMLYVVLYFVLQSADYALLVGSLISFAAVAVTMIATRNERWYRSEAPDSDP